MSEATYEGGEFLGAVARLDITDHTTPMKTANAPAMVGPLVRRQIASTTKTPPNAVSACRMIPATISFISPPSKLFSR